jgi:hypothetical protein
LTDTNSTTTGCPGCAFRDEQLDIIVRARGKLIEANFALAARVARLEREIGRRAEEDRHRAEMLVGLADLQRVEVGK